MSDVRLTPVDDEPAARFVELLDAQGATDLAVYQARAHGRYFRVHVSRDPMGRGPDGASDFRWHISITCVGSSQPPQWRSLTAIVHAVRPGVPFVVGIPPRSQWINVHPGCLHALETRDENLIAQWRFEGRGHAPS